MAQTDRERASGARSRGDGITYEGWDALARLQAARPLVGKAEAYEDWAAIRSGTREPLAAAIAAEASACSRTWPPPA
ncbi:hypothetical protein [Streptomyces sp. NPDC054849]